MIQQSVSLMGAVGAKQIDLRVKGLLSAAMMHPQFVDTLPQQIQSLVASTHSSPTPTIATFRPENEARSSATSSTPPARAHATAISKEE